MTEKFQMTFWRGNLSRTGEGRQFTVEVERLFPGVGKMVCMECEGTGKWPFGPESKPDDPCIECKGSGYRLVSCF